MILNPIVSGRAPDETDSIFIQEKENSVTDHISIVITGDKLLGFIDLKVLKGIYAKGREQFDDIRARDRKIRHMVGLIEKSAGLHPGTLFISPVRKLAGDLRIDIRSYLRITRELNWIPDRL
jgi:hypothetical protein